LYSWTVLEGIFCIHGQSLKGVQVQGPQSPAGVIVEVLGIRISHLANLQCASGWRHMVVSGSGRSRNGLAAARGFSPTVAARHPKF